MLVFGEILWDLLPSGKKPGGAPANFAFHADALGAESYVATKVGDDELGREIGRIFVDHHLSLRFLEVDSELPTGTVVVHLNEHGQPSYEIVENVAWDRIEAGRSVLDFAKSVDLFYFGSLAARGDANRQTLHSLLDVLPENCLRVFDLNLRAPFYNRKTIEPLLQKTDVFKLNDDELFIVAEMFNDRITLARNKENGLFGPDKTINEEVRNWIVSFIHLFDLDYLILTAGAQGSFLFDSKGNDSFAPARETKIADTIGAGDSFTAVCALGFLNGRPLSEINTKANQYAAFVCSQNGAMPDVPHDLKSIYE